MNKIIVPSDINEQVLHLQTLAKQGEFLSDILRMLLEKVDSPDKTFAVILHVRLAFNLLPKDIFEIQRWSGLIGSNGITDQELNDKLQASVANWVQDNK
jgi:hypothetical protein